LLSLVGADTLKDIMRRSSLILSFCVFTVACSSVRDPTVWRSELPSPDGGWIAIAHTEQEGGFGSADIETGVDLKRSESTVNQGKPTNVLEISCNGPVAHAYTLDNKANAGGTIGLTMHWLTPKHLEISYNGSGEVNFQVVRLAGLDVSLRDLSKAATAPAPH
jgi:hypothetical protein